MAFTVSRRGLAGFAAGATSVGFVISSAQADTLDETLKNNVLRVGIHRGAARAFDPAFAVEHQACFLAARAARRRAAALRPTSARTLTPD